MKKVDHQINSIIKNNELIDESIDEIKNELQFLAKSITSINVSLFYETLSFSLDEFLLLKFQENLNGTTTYSASCQEYFEQGDQRNGTYFIRPSLSRKEFRHK